jgi:two-component system LytT family sensor kinase
VTTLTLLAALAGTVLLAAVAWWVLRRRRDQSRTGDRTTFQTLHTASLASGPLRLGLTQTSAERAARHLRMLLSAPAVAVTDTVEVLAWDGPGQHHRTHAMALAHQVLAEGSPVVQRPPQVSCDRINCSLQSAVAVPLVVEDLVVGTLIALAPTASAGLVRTTSQVGIWVSSQLELAELDKSRTALMEAEVRALRAQISPHFVYNSLSAIASFVRTDPERARELLLEFADFTRYSFRRHGDYTTLAEELRSIERYLVLERARFGDRLEVTLRIAPEVLAVKVPFLSIQPLVENAVRHGIERKEGPGRVTIIAQDVGSEALITIEDDGVGEDPERVRRALAGDGSTDSVGLGNVDERLRATFGDAYGLVVETAPGAGTQVTVRVPKYAPGTT